MDENLKKMWDLYVSATVSKFCTPKECCAYRDGVMDCLKLMGFSKEEKHE